MGQSGDEQGCFLSKATVSDIWTSQAVGGKSERPSSTEYLIKWVHRLRPWCSKNFVVSLSSKKNNPLLLPFLVVYLSLRLCLFVQTILWVQVNLFLFLALCYSVTKKHINCLMVYLIHPVDPLEYDPFLCSWSN